MAYHLYTKSHQSRSSPLSAPPGLPLSHYNRHNRPPPSHPPPLISPQTAIDQPSNSKRQTNTDPAFHPEPYPHAITSGYPTPHTHITIETISTAHIPSLTRITSLLLPIRYPNSFYTATITDPVIASLSRVAIYHDHPLPATATTTVPRSTNTGGGTDKVIGGIRCRLERLPTTTTTEILNSQSKSRQEPTNLYIQTLHLLSPYRGHGVAASLLNSLLFSSPPALKISGTASTDYCYHVSELVRHYNIRTVTAHVHEANDDALAWYLARGFKVEDGVVENYYRRLKPSGARIMRLTLRWNDRVEDQSGTDTGREDGENQSQNEDDDDWEKIEAEDADEQDHGVRLLSGSRIVDSEEGARKKRKTDGHASASLPTDT